MLYKEIRTCKDITLAPQEVLTGEREHSRENKAKSNFYDEQMGAKREYITQHSKPATF